MTDKNKVPTAVMVGLYEVASRGYENYQCLLDGLFEDVDALGFWVYGGDHDSSVTRIREQAVIDYVFNGADNFEVKTPTWVIVSKNSGEDGDWYFLRKDTNFIPTWCPDFGQSKAIALDFATRITDPKLKDALLYANKDFEAIEVEE
ncbi:hypothetical protein G7084_01365 [Weissella coleopterorum]|uniref:Uncharacterized protein n=1 Tax=Weissella coleopterorum TaxID=2714949 RepID=A0A6G8AYK6_9LACO|nr:hypothetical protein [Weissella coleopterorum]QIL50086.1 hypothetical protein G7084_01365 [Weissella coleopterorum]